MSCNHNWKQTETTGTTCVHCGAKYQRPLNEGELIAELEEQLAECIGVIENIFGGGGPELVPDWIMEEIERRENW